MILTSQLVDFGLKWRASILWAHGWNVNGIHGASSQSLCPHKRRSRVARQAPLTLLVDLTLSYLAVVLSKMTKN